MNLSLKKLAIKYQVASEQHDRLNQKFLEDTRAWLESENIDPARRKIFLLHLNSLVEEVSNCRKAFKRQMDYGAQE